MTEGWRSLEIEKKEKKGWRLRSIKRKRDVKNIKMNGGRDFRKDIENRQTHGQTDIVSDR
jgi:hypothetical protein